MIIQSLQTPIINVGSPLAKGLVWNTVPSATNRFELIKKGAATFLTSGTWGGNNLMGTGVLNSSSTSNGGAYWPWSTLIETITNRFSVVVFVNPVSVTDNTHFFCLPYNSNWSSPFDAISFQNSSPDTSKLQLQFSISGALKSATTGSTGLVASAMGLTMFGVIYDGAKVRFWKNGIYIEEVTPSGTGNVDFGSYKTSVELMNRHHADTGEGFSGQTNFAGLWNRVLTDSEMKSIYLNPWQLYVKPKLFSFMTPEVIAFESAANSGDVAAANTYSGSASWSGNNRMLSIDVSMLGPGVSVTSMTYGGAACTLIGSKSTVTSLGGVECWRIIQSDSGAPAAGSNTLVVNLSGSIEFSVEWVAYSGVHQTSPTEGFNSAQATNAGSATDASVAITTVADNDWVHATVVANDTSITAGNTTRNNISGTLGSGANEDNNGPQTPAGAVTMSYSGMGITTTWAIAGYAIRPVAAASLAALVARLRSLLGVGL